MHKSEDYDQTEPDEPTSLDIFSDEPSEKYGTAADHEARRRVQAALAELQTALDTPRPIGIGHNRPPEEEEEPEEIKELRPAIAELSAELAKPNPVISLVKQWAIPLRNSLIASSKWAFKKVYKALDGAATAAGATGIAWIGAHYSASLHHAFEAVVNWLDIVTKGGGPF